MGRSHIFREKVKYLTGSVATKNPRKWLRDITINRFGLSEAEAELLARKALQYIKGCPSFRESEQIVFPLVEGRDSHSKKYRSTKRVKLTPFCFDDLELYRELDLKSMQTSRILRMIEEAYAQDALFSMDRLSFLTCIEKNALRDRLKPLWSQGIRLPISGIKKSTREGFECFRATRAMRELLSGKKPTAIREDLFLTRSQIEDYRLQLHTAFVQGPEAVTGPPRLGQELYELALEFDVKPETPAISDQPETRTEFIEHLRSGHDFSPLKAKLYVDMLDDYVLEETDENRPPNTITYWAVAADEPAGKSIADCQLVPVSLAYYTKEEQEGYQGRRTRDLKWERLMRFTTQARRDGGLLAQADLAFLLGIHPGVIQKLEKENDNVQLPTRGILNDIGTGLSHIEKIVELYLQGYTESQIKRRTNHSYDAIENYLRTFAAVMVLHERGLPRLMIRKVVGKSMQLVETHLELYEKYKDREGAQLVLMQLRNAFERQNGAEGNFLKT